MYAVPLFVMTVRMLEDRKVSKGESKTILTRFVDWKIEVLYFSKAPEDLSDVIFCDVFCQFFYHDLLRRREIQLSKFVDVVAATVWTATSQQE